MPVVAGGVLALADRDEALGVWEAAMSSGASAAGCARLPVNTWQGWTWLLRGELAEAAASLGEAFEQIQPLETNGAWMAYIAAFLARVRLEQGDLAGAHGRAGALRDPGPGSDGDTSRGAAGSSCCSPSATASGRAPTPTSTASGSASVDNAAWGRGAR
jgi:hypothetical protein